MQSLNLINATKLQRNSDHIKSEHVSHMKSQQVIENQWRPIDNHVKSHESVETCNKLLNTWNIITNDWTSWQTIENH